MGVESTTANLYLQLGIAGATLLILLVFVVLLFKLITKMNQSWQTAMKDIQKNENTTQSNTIEKLCDKIDALITSNSEYTNRLNEVLLSNDKDQKVLIRTLDKVQLSLEEILKKVVRIDDRTHSCLGNSKKKEEE